AMGLGVLVFAMSVPAFAAGNVAAGKAKAAMCAGCHGAEGNGGGDPSWPKLAGQHENYIIQQLKAFKSGTRKDPIMSGMAAGLSNKDIENVAAYFSSQTIQTGAASNEQLAKQGEHVYRGGNSKMGVSACMSCHGPSG